MAGQTRTKTNEFRNSRTIQSDLERNAVVAIFSARQPRVRVRPVERFLERSGLSINVRPISARDSGTFFSPPFGSFGGIVDDNTKMTVTRLFRGLRRRSRLIKRVARVHGGIRVGRRPVRWTRGGRTPD